MLTVKALLGSNSIMNISGAIFMKFLRAFLKEYSAS